ncbi:ethylbenzene dehydrogenase-related protein [Halobacteriaceae archaeon GCM10025711]
MTDRSTVTATTVLVAGLVLLAVFAPTLASARAANQIPVASMPEQGDALGDPAADAWGDVEPAAVPLSSAPSGLPEASDTSTEAVEVRAAHTDSRLYIHMTWDDATANEEITGPRSFLDAAAVQLPANTSTHPGIALGSERAPVNVWYWYAGNGTQEILAGGPGSTTALDQSVVTTNAHRTDGGWEVVFVRDLQVDGENRTQFTMDRDVDVAFAVWNGSNMERSGRHAVSEWHHFPLGPDEQPPFQTILWVVAGIAVAVVLVVTVRAVRNTGSR